MAAAIIIGVNYFSSESIICWDGESVPVPANIPAGVTVTYQNVTYTGTLVASETTRGRKYLVRNGSTGLNVYDEYVTLVDVSTSTYRWEMFGPSEIRISKLVSVATVQSFTESEKKQGCDNVGAAYAPSVKTSLDSTLVDSVEYRIGTVSTLALNLPTSGIYGIKIVFVASAAFTPTITVEGSAITPKGNAIPTTVSGKTYEFLLSWNGSDWVLEYLYYA